LFLYGRTRQTDPQLSAVATGKAKQSKAKDRLNSEEDSLVDLVPSEQEEIRIPSGNE
jgi:hypothetical protein